MITFIYGNDVDARRGEQDKAIAAFIRKYPEAPTYRFSPEGWSYPSFVELVNTRSFFNDTYLVVVRDIVSHKEHRDELFETQAELLLESPHVILFVDESHDKEAGRFVKGLDGAQVIERKKTEKKTSSFDPFSLGSAVVERDKKDAWVLLQKALRDDVAPEELFGPLLWKIKDTMIKQGKNRVYTEAELTELSRKMITAFHAAHRGGLALELALEHIILSL